MADSAIPITGGSGYSVDTRTESTNANHRQVIVIGDPATNGGVAPVDGSTGLSVNVTNASIPITDNSGSLTVDDGGSSLTVDGTVAATQSGTWNVTNISGTVSLPTGAATSAKQDTGNTSLANIETSVGLIDDAVYTDGSGTPSKAIAVAGTDGTNPQILSTNSSGHVNIADGGNTITVDGTVGATQSGTWNVTNVSGTVSLPTGASTSAKQDLELTSLQLIDDIIYTDGAGTPSAGALVMGTDGTNPQAIAVTTAGVVKIDDNGSTISIDDGSGSITVDGTITANLGTLNGAATAAKQPALGTAGSASTDVITVQGIASMTPIQVDGSGTTQPVSGTVTANAGTGFPALITDGSAAGTTGIHIVGTDGTNGQIISTNTSGHVNIADGGNSITVDGTVTVNALPTGTNTIGSVKVTDGTTVADILDLTNHNPLTVAIVDTNGDQIASFGGGTQYTEDVASAADPVGTMGMAVRADTLSAVTSTDGDNIANRSTNKGELYVKHVDSIPITDNSGSITVDNGGTFAVQAAQSGTWDVGTVTTITNVVHVDDNSSSLTVDNGGTFAVQDSQVLADNAGFTDGTTKLFATGYIYDEVAGTALTENDIAAPRINVNRATVGIVEDGATRGRYATVTASNALKVDASGVAVPITDNSGSLTVDNGGTFAVQAAQSGTWNIGTVSTVTNVVHVDDNSSTLSIDDGAGSITVDNGGTFAVQATIAAGATAIAKAEDVASADADVGVPAMAVRKATPANTSGTDGDYEMLQMSAGRLWTSATIDTALPAGTNAIGKLSSNTGVTIGAVEIASGQTLGTVSTITNVVHVDDNSGSLTVDNNGTFATQATLTPSATSTALSLFRNTALSNTAVAVKGSGGRIHKVHFYNPNTSDAYIQFYNVAQGSVTVGTTTPDWTWWVPAGGAIDDSLPIPIGGGTALTVAATTTIAGGTAPSSGLLANIGYI